MNFMPPPQFQVSPPPQFAWLGLVHAGVLLTVPTLAVNVQHVQ
jgi:hypothetical protein